MCALADRGHDIAVLTSNYGNKQTDYPNQRVFRHLILSATAGNIYQPFNASSEERARISEYNAVETQKILNSVDPDLVFVWNLHFYEPSLLQVLEESGRRLVYLLTDNWMISVYNSRFIADYFCHRVYASTGMKRMVLKNFAAHAVHALASPNKVIEQGRDLANKALRHIRRRFSSSEKDMPALKGSAIFASRFMRKLHNEAGFDFPDSVIIHHGVTTHVNASGPKVDRSHLVKKGEIRLLFAGRLVEIKGVQTAVDALPRIIRMFPRHRVLLDIVGDARDKPYVDRLNRLVQELDLGDRVRFLPPVPEKDLFGLFQDHDIYLFTSLYEPFSLTLIHALQAGIPTVASDIGGNPEIVLSGQTGLLYPKSDAKALADQVVRYVSNDKLRANIADRASNHANEFTFKRMIDHIQQYLIAVNSRGNSGS
jgi:glycosyltransferase involved in cell wall biosynthesis